MNTFSVVCNSMKTAIKTNVVNKIFTFFLTVILTVVSCGKISHEKFDSEKWKTSDLNAEENWNLRWDMMNDLRNKHKLVGLTKNEALKLLGKPDSENNYEMNYYLGFSGRGINTGRLTLILDKNGIVKNIKVWQG